MKLRKFNCFTIPSSCNLLRKLRKKIDSIFFEIFKQNFSNVYHVIIAKKH